MIDLRRLRDDPDALRASQRARGDDPALVDAVLAADEERRTALGEFEALRAEQKTLGRAVAKATGDERDTVLARARELAEAVK
ncbi:MAG: serine--tRNA ligase, partial [Jiangellales bacterium]